MSFVSCNLCGGLGNQLFQIFNTFAYGFKYNKRPIFPGTEVVLHERKTYWSTFLSIIKEYTTYNTDMNTTVEDIYNLPKISENGFEYNEIPNIEGSVQLHGYYQSYKYFQKYTKDITSMLKIKEQKEKILKNGALKEQDKYDTSHTISMHFRLGDYKGKPDHHPVITKDYYTNALNHILFERLSYYNDEYINFIVYYCCEEEDLNDVLVTINFLKKNYPNIEFIKISNTYDDWEQMIFLSCCDDNIIANSTFSWWSAYLNERKDKIICYPSVWFGYKLPANLKDLFPDSWKKIYF